MKNKLKVLIAIDKFKDSLGVHALCNTLERGIWENLSPRYQSIETRAIPLSDGGDGFIDVLYPLLKGQSLKLFDTPYSLRRVVVDSVGPLFESRQAEYLEVTAELTGDKMAFMEVANISGLPLVPEEKRSPY